MNVRPDLIKDCINRKRKAEYELYKVTYSYLMSICIRYTRNQDLAKENLNIGFLKILTNLEKYNPEVPFKAWIRKIMIRTALSHLRDNKKHIHHKDLEDTIEEKGNNIFNKLSEKEILVSVTKLPPGFKKIFMLYTIEGYNHREIAEMLGCSEGTCKSQFYRSRNRLQKILLQSA